MKTITENSTCTNHDLPAREENKEADTKWELVQDYRRFGEFKDASDEQILQVDHFLRSYSELVYYCVSRPPQQATVIPLDDDYASIKAA